MKIYAVGIGPGARDLLSPRAEEALRVSDVVIGHTPYLAQIDDLVEGKTVLASGMRHEIERCREAINQALKGHVVSVVSSGDAGIYGMGGLLLELIEDMDAGVELEVIPGISAANGAASALGAPLMNDFAVISLSDLLTPQDIIRKRIAKVAEADIVCVLYNPSSRKRKELVQEVMATFCEVRGSETLCGVVKNATRNNEEIWIGEASELPFDMLDMSTVVLVGNSQTVLKGGKMVTLRGYNYSL